MFAKIKLLQDGTIAGVQQHYVVRKIVGDQQSVRALVLVRDDGKAGRIRNCSSGWGMTKSIRHTFAAGNLLRRDP